MQLRQRVAGPIGRIFSEPAWFIAFMAVYMPACLWADANGPRAAQAVVSVLTWTVLGLALVSVRREERVQLVVVVAIATTFELLFSIVWGMYIYRFHNLPLYVPPGHGLFYLLALRIGQVGVVARHPRTGARLVFGVVLVWVVLGLTTLNPVADVVGLLLVPWLTYCLLFTGPARQPVYVGAFLATSALEIVGTGFGNWAWQQHIPGLGIPMGNPPSAISSGYFLLDWLVLAASARIAYAASRAVARSRRAEPAAAVERA